MLARKSDLRHKVGTRIALLFVICALAPITLLSGLAYVQVMGHLKEQARLRLRNESKAVSMALIERLTFLEKELNLLGTAAGEGRDVAPYLSASSKDDNVADPFTAVAILFPDGRQQTLFGAPMVVPPLSAAQHAHLATGRSVVLTGGAQGNGRQVLLLQACAPQQPARGMIGARINPDYLWANLGADEPTAPAQFCVLSESNAVIFAQAPVSAEFQRGLVRAIQRSSAGLFECDTDGQAEFVGYWSVFLQYHFAVPKWTVVMAVSRRSVLAPASEFKRGFPLLVLLALWVVVALTFSEVRRRMRPLAELTVRTREIANRNFDSRAVVSTGDEFEDLALSFNRMAATLGQQFRALSAIMDIDNAVLAAQDIEGIADQALRSLGSVVSVRPLAIALVHTNGARHAWNAWMCLMPSGTTGSRTLPQQPLKEPELVALSARPEGMLYDARNGLPRYLEALAAGHVRTVLTLPILLKGHLEGMISAGLEDAQTAPENSLHLRQVADQLALALSHTKLVAALRQQNQGIVLALARAVDAKSPWTRGHSERVTRLSEMIAREIGYEAKQVEDLRRGALLHDVGKIGVPAQILDKAGPLTVEERMVIQEHPRMGRRIVEPIDARAEIIDIISQHHERYDGKGYPLGLEGDAISLSARIVAVADVMDAVTADRPYRKGMAFEEAVALITRDSGKAFDPLVVEAFLRVTKAIAKSTSAWPYPEEPDPWSTYETA